MQVSDELKGQPNRDCVVTISLRQIELHAAFFALHNTVLPFTLKLTCNDRSTVIPKVFEMASHQTFAALSGC